MVKGSFFAWKTRQLNVNNSAIKLGSKQGIAFLKLFYGSNKNYRDHYKKFINKKLYGVFCTLPECSPCFGNRDYNAFIAWILQSFQQKVVSTILDLPIYKYHLPKVIENSRNNTDICNIKRVSDPVSVPGVEIKYRGLKLTSLLNLFEDKQPLPDLI